ncbi:MAG: GNAT family N-acetyltransferase [Gammaproteobacteria bacterium]|nr:GNAT family N-acetyltransferase [Gammaproteobacteria bacterium]
MDEHYRITHMNQADMALAIKWAADAGWNPGLHDEHCFYKTDPNGFFIGRLNNQPIAIGSAVIYDAHFAFCGFYIVDPAYRGEGYGLALTKARLAYIGTRNAGIDGVLEMLNKYERLGYKMAHHNARYEMQSGLLADIRSEQTILALNKVPFAALAAYDRRHFPAARDVFLKCWIKQVGASGFAVMKDDVLCGYGVIRPCQKGVKIGPLFADTEAIANSLFVNLVQAVEDGPVYLDCPLNNPHAMALVKRYDLQQVFETARMYLKHEPALATDAIYGITTFELG